MKLTAILLLLIAAPVAHTQFGARRLPAPPLTSVPADIPAATSAPDFPLRVHIYTARYGGYNPTYYGFGSGNVDERSSTHGFDYTFECSIPFTENAGLTDFYQARWRKQPYRLELLMGRAGSDKQDTCTLQIALRPTAFDPYSIAKLSGANPYRRNRVYLTPDVAFVEPDPDYPVQLHILSVAPSMAGVNIQGYGNANLLTQAGATVGADFTYSCGYGFLPNSTFNGFYQGHWVEPDRRLDILMQRTGSDKIDRCELRITEHPQPYNEPRSPKLRKTATP